MHDDPLSVSSLTDIDNVLDAIIQRLYGLYDAKYEDPSEDERNEVWERVDQLYDYVVLVADDVARTRFLQTIQELK
jgi:hypothetical protein